MQLLKYVLMFVLGGLLMGVVPEVVSARKMSAPNGQSIEAMLKIRDDLISKHYTEIESIKAALVQINQTSVRNSLETMLVTRNVREYVGIKKWDALHEKNLKLMLEELNNLKR